jgi:myo-inositol 2-dehydrogenase / D-chiro-inositol 1-dehydrogenase
MIKFCLFGAGRIGAIHAGNIAAHPDARLCIIVDPDRAAAERLARHHDAAIGNQLQALGDPAVDARW